MSRVDVSVLVPIYNTAEYLMECLDSLKSQTLKSIEFICIDDGSTDNSYEIVDSYVRSDSRFKLIHQENAGYGAALNRGLQEAGGSFIGIVESDDFIDEDMFEQLLGIAQANDCDMVKSDRIDMRNGSEEYVKMYSEECYGRVFESIENQAVFSAAPAIWTGLYRFDFLKKNNIVFHETPGAAYQDTSFSLMCLLAAEKIWISNCAYYHYRRDRDTASSSVKTNVFTIVKEYELLEENPYWMRLIKKNASGYSHAKFRSFIWNYKRIDWLYKFAFAHEIQRIFSFMKENRLLNTELFEKNELEDLIHIMENDEQWFELQRNQCVYIRREKTLESKYNQIRESKAYRLSRIIGAPFRAIRR